MISYASDNNCIAFKKNFSDYGNKNMYDIDLYINDCGKRKEKIDTFGYFGDNPKINFYFFQKNNSINRLFVSTYVYTNNYEDNPKYVYEDGRYNFTYTYDCNELKCKKNQKLSDFFGDGANLIDVKNYKVVSKFPYTSISDIKAEINSKLFKLWFGNQLKTGIILNKTNIYQNYGINSKKLGYLIPNDKFEIKGITSRWLNIVYSRENGGEIKGWISCDDTNICH